MRISLADLRRVRTYLLLAALVWTLSAILGAQTQAHPQGKEHQVGAQEPLRTAQASRVDRAPKMDGTLDDPLWQQATPITNFLQREPYEGQPSD